MNRKNFLKNKKINWIKVVIQILSFALIPGLFEGVFGMDAAGDGSGGDYCGKVFLRIFLQLWGSAGFVMVWLT